MSKIAIELKNAPDGFCTKEGKRCCLWEVDDACEDILFAHCAAFPTHRIGPYPDSEEDNIEVTRCEECYKAEIKE